MKIHDNYIHHNGRTGAVLGGGDPATDYVFLRNCYFYNNIVALNGDDTYPAILMGGENGGGNQGDWYIYNNVFYHNNNGEIFVSFGSTPTSIVIKNNIIFPSTGQSYYTGITGAFYSGSNNIFRT